MLDIIIYIILALIFGIVAGLFIAAALLDRRAKKHQMDLARLIGARGNGKTGGHMFPYCYLDQEEEEEPDYYIMQEGPDEPEDYMEQCYEYELKCKENDK